MRVASTEGLPLEAGLLAEQRRGHRAAGECGLEGEELIDSRKAGPVS